MAFVEGSHFWQPDVSERSGAPGNQCEGAAEILSSQWAVFAKGCPAGALPRSIVPAAPLHSRVISGPEERIDKNLVGPAMVRRSAGAVTRTSIPGSARSGFEYTRV